jgi:MSHA biogenesis protein MshJ
MNGGTYGLVRRVGAGLRWIDAQPMRQRVLLLVAALAVLFAFWDAVLMRSVKTRRTVAEADIEKLEKQVQALEAKSESIVQVLAADPNLDRRQRREELRRQLAELDARFSEQTADLIPPSEMVRVLKEVLGHETMLQLVRVESLQAEPVLAESEIESDVPASRIPIFKHGLVMELLGDYLSTLRYLEAVEDLPWHFFWESFEYQVEEYPEGRVKLKVLSLSTQEGWIGV